MLSQQGVSLQFAEVKDFSGGITENVISGDPTSYKTADNFYITDDLKPITRPGLALVDAANARLASNAAINCQSEVLKQVFQISNKGIYYNSSGLNHITGPSGNEAFPLASATSSYAWSRWNNQLLKSSSAYDHPVKVFHDTTWKMHELGMPPLASTPTITATGSGKTYLYAFYYSYSYTVDGITYTEKGPVTLVPTPVVATNDPGTTPISISVIPVLSNSTTRNWDTANVKLNIFRTINAGTTYLYSGQVANGTTTYSDNVSDATLLAVNNPLYITGGTLEYLAPPKCKYVHQVGGVTYYCNIIGEDGVTYPNRFRLSNVDQPSAAPGENEETLDEEIIGVSSFNSYPIIFCKNKVYRVSGNYLPDGQGSVTKQVISETAGCLSHASIIQTEYGVFWAGVNGFYYTDGTSVTRISGKFNKTYKTITSTSNQQQRIIGTYYPKYQLVLWGMQVSSVGSNPDTLYVCHLKAGISPTMPFTTWSGGSQLPTNFAPTSLFHFDGTLYHGDSRGYQLYYSDDAQVDVKIDTTTAATNWTTTTIMYLHESISSDFGSASLRKWVPMITMVADNYSSVSLRVSAANDNSGYYKDLAIVKYKGSAAWGDYDIAWGDPLLQWNYSPIIKAKRRMPKGGLRCMYKQVRFANAFSEIENSVSFGSKALVNAAAKTLTLVSGTWPPDLVDYVVLLSNDSYQIQYPVTVRTDSVLTVTDATNGLPTGTYDWQIYGYRRGEVLKLISYSVLYDATSASEDPAIVGQT